MPTQRSQVSSLSSNSFLSSSLDSVRFSVCSFLVWFWIVLLDEQWSVEVLNGTSIVICSEYKLSYHAFGKIQHQQFNMRISLRRVFVYFSLCDSLKICGCVSFFLSLSLSVSSFRSFYLNLTFFLPFAAYSFVAQPGNTHSHTRTHTHEPGHIWKQNTWKSMSQINMENVNG